MDILQVIRDLVWPVVVIAFVGVAFLGVMWFVRYAVTEHDAAVGGATKDVPEAAVAAPPPGAAPA
jgi:hypothetical protein